MTRDYFVNVIFQGFVVGGLVAALEFIVGYVYRCCKMKTCDHAQTNVVE